MTMVPNPIMEVATVVDPALEVVDIPVEAATAPYELHPEVKVQLAWMEPIFHDTFLSILQIYLPACFQP